MRMLAERPRGVTEYPPSCPVPFMWDELNERVRRIGNPLDRVELPTPPSANVRPRHVSPSARFTVLQRDGFTCQYCGRGKGEVPLHIDHVFPVSKGGTSAIENLVTACRDCNIGKGARVLAS